MSITIRGVYRNGNIIPLEEIPVQEETEVAITFLSGEQAVDKEKTEGDPVEETWGTFKIDKELLKYFAEDVEIEYESS